MTRTTIPPHAPADPIVAIETRPHSPAAPHRDICFWIGPYCVNLSAPHAAAIGRAMIDAAQQQEADAMIAEAGL